MFSREYPEHPLVGVGGLVVRDGQVLLVRRANEPLRHEWSIPGGLVEAGEELARAVVREVLEETGLRVSAGPVIEVLDRITRDDQGRVRFHYVLVDFLCQVEGGELAAGSDAGDCRWVERSNLEAYNLRPETTSVVEKAFRTANT